MMTTESIAEERRQATVSFICLEGDFIAEAPLPMRLYACTCTQTLLSGASQIYILDGAREKSCVEVVDAETFETRLLAEPSLGIMPGVFQGPNFDVAAVEAYTDELGA